MKKPADHICPGDRILNTLNRLADPREARVQRSFYKKDTNIVLIGIKVPLIRRVVKDFIASYSLNREAILSSSEKLVSSEVHEHKMAGVILLELNKNLITHADLNIIKRWFLNNYINDWAVIDTLCLTVISHLAEHSKNVRNTVMKWREYENIYIKRASIVSFIKHARKEELVDTLLEHSIFFFGISHDLITKANGWLLREVGKTKPDKLENFLINNIKRIPRTTLRYAIEKFPEPKRQEILKIPYK